MHLTSGKTLRFVTTISQCYNECFTHCNINTLKKLTIKTKKLMMILFNRLQMSTWLLLKLQELWKAFSNCLCIGISRKVGVSCNNKISKIYFNFKRLNGDFTRCIIKKLLFKINKDSLCLLVVKILLGSPTFKMYNFKLQHHNKNFLSKETVWCRFPNPVSYNRLILEQEEKLKKKLVKKTNQCKHVLAK
jgi:hypothetical protein